MLVHYKTPGAVGGWTLLFDEAAGDANEKFTMTFRDAIMKVAGYGAANELKVPLMNTSCQLPFKWSQNYATEAAGAAGIATVRAAFKGLTKHLRCTVGATVLYFPNAVMSGSSHDQHGIEVMHQLNFETDDVTTTEPT